jgi:hypothetical protein
MSIHPRRDAPLRGLLECVGDLDQSWLAAGTARERDAVWRWLGIESGRHAR